MDNTEKVLRKCRVVFRELLVNPDVRTPPPYKNIVAMLIKEIGEIVDVPYLQGAVIIDIRWITCPSCYEKVLESKQPLEYKMTCRNCKATFYLIKMELKGV